MNWASNIQTKIRQDAQQPLSILEDLVEDGCNFVDDFLSRFNSTQLAPTTELVKTPSRRHGSTRRTRAAMAAAQKSAKKIQQINEDVFNDDIEEEVNENNEANKSEESPPKESRESRKSPSPSRLPLSTKQHHQQPQASTSKPSDTPVNTFHRALLNMRDDKMDVDADKGGADDAPGGEKDAQREQPAEEAKKAEEAEEAEEVEEVLDEPQEVLAEPPSPPSLPSQDAQRKQKTSTDFTAPIRGDDDDSADKEKDKAAATAANSPPRKSLAFASLPRRSPLKKSISTAKDGKDPALARASWLSQSVKSKSGGTTTGLDSERSSAASKRKSDKVDDGATEQTSNARKFKKSVSYEQHRNTSRASQANHAGHPPEPKTPADALAQKTAEIRKRLTQVAGTQRKVNLFDLPPKEAPISLASEPVVPEQSKTAQQSQSQSQAHSTSHSHSQAHSHASSINAPSIPQADESTTPPNSPPKKRGVESWDSRMSVNIPGAYPASDAGGERDEREKGKGVEKEKEPEPEPEPEPSPIPEPEPVVAEPQAPPPPPAPVASHKDKDIARTSHKSSQDEPMDLSEITQQQKKQQQQEREKREEVEASKNKRKLDTHEVMDVDGIEADEDEQFRPAKQQMTTQHTQSTQHTQHTQHAQPKPSLTIKPLQTTNKFRPRAGSTDSDKKNQFSTMLNSNVTQMGKSLNKKPTAVRMSSSTAAQRLPSQAAVQVAQKEAADRVAAEKEKEREKDRKLALRKEQEARRVQAQKEAHDKQEAERRAQRDELAKRRREREEAAAAKKVQQQQERAAQQQRDKERIAAANAANKKANDDEQAARKLAASTSGTTTSGPVRPMHQRTTSATRVSNAPVRGLRPSASNGALGYKAAHGNGNGKEKEKEAEPAMPLPKPVPLINKHASNNTESIELPDINSEYSDSEDEAPKNYELPRWAESPNLRAQLQMQSTINPDEVFGMMRPLSMDDIFGVGPATNPNRHKFRARTSSANWSGADKLTPAEELAYAERMGFHGASKEKEKENSKRS